MAICPLCRKRIPYGLERNALMGKIYTPDAFDCPNCQSFIKPAYWSRLLSGFLVLFVSVIFFEAMDHLQVQWLPGNHNVRIALIFGAVLLLVLLGDFLCWELIVRLVPADSSEMK